MTLYKEGAEKLALFYDFIREYENKKKTTKMVRCFGLVEFWSERYFIEKTTMFESHRLQYEEDTQFEGEVYTDVTDIFDELLYKLRQLLTRKEKLAAVEEETRDLSFLDLYAITNYYSLQNQTHRHDLIIGGELLSLKAIEGFFIGTEKEFYDYLDEEYDEKTIQYSHRYVTYEAIEKELELAEKKETIYHFTQKKFRHLKNYEEKAYYLPALDRYYVKGSGDPAMTMVLDEEEDETNWHEGFSHFTEEGFAAFLFARFKNEDLEGFKTIQEVPEIQRIYKKYRLKTLFENH